MSQTFGANNLNLIIKNNKIWKEKNENTHF